MCKCANELMCKFANESMWQLLVTGDGLSAVVETRHALSLPLPTANCRLPTVDCRLIFWFLDLIIGIYFRFGVWGFGFNCGILAKQNNKLTTCQ